MAELVPGTLEALDATPSTLRAMLASLPSECVEMRGQEGWSARDVVVHLASRQRAALAGRLGMMLDEDCPSLPGIPHEKTVQAYALKDAPLLDILDDHAIARGEAMELVRSLTPEQLGRTAKQGVAGIVSVTDIVHHIAYHDLIHIAQINALLREPIDKARGAMRVFK
jgi:uncharacterized damage-inducible protein DinB